MTSIGDMSPAMTHNPSFVVLSCLTTSLTPRRTCLNLDAVFQLLLKEEEFNKKRKKCVSYCYCCCYWERETILWGRIQQRILPPPNNEKRIRRRRRRRTRETKRRGCRSSSSSDITTPLLFICLPFLTTFNNFLVNFPSANGEAIAHTGFCFSSSSPSPPLLADDGTGNPSRSRFFEDFGVSFFSFLAFFALFSPLEPII